MNFVPCVKWVKCGVAKSNPEKIKLSPDELRKLIAEEKQKDLEDEEEDNSEDEMKNSDNDEAGYDMKNYDKDENDTLSGAMGLGSVTVLEEQGSSFSKMKLDDTDSEIENEIIREDDNLLLVGHVQDDMSILEVYIYNHLSKDFYVHHDILLPSVPLCFEWLGYDPQSTEHGNLCAIGDMSPVINIWDLDIVDCLKPAFSLGKKKKQPKKGYKHTDAVLDIVWNTNAAHILASASVDETVLLWDLDECIATTQMSHFEDKVQMLKWHPHELHTLLTGSSDEKIRIYDCRTYNSFMTWKVNGEIEKGVWNANCPFSCFVGTSNGFLYNIDVRSNKPVWEIKAFEKEVTGLYANENITDKLYACSNEEVLKVYSNLTETEPQLVSQKQINIGEIMCLEGNPNHSNIVALGGTKRCKNLTLVNVNTVFIKDKDEDDELNEEEDEDSDIDDVEGFFGVKSSNERKKSKNKKKMSQDSEEETFKPTPFSHLDETLVKLGTDVSSAKQKKIIKKQKKKMKTIDKMKKKKKQEKMQNYQEKMRKQRK